jgi:hypothetical protein
MPNFDPQSILRLVLLIIFILLFVLGVIFAIRQQRAWKPPLVKREKLYRSIIVGFSAYVVCLSFLFLLDLFSTSGPVKFPLPEVIVFQCITVPIFVVATVGSYIGFSTQDKIYVEGKKRIEKEK